ncbi:hypothetical protein Y032_0063g3461 [Ancylostoma ceylanicum]|uniref:Uncharacterized protein n=1 Tax=Ancylostoma ceylanicum TaxID=53326 RepID=A0A016U282_9BILA|nr:hypothetical protein Y032_0063g3461 [Ancylostoma ceylanicum]
MVLKFLSVPTNKNCGVVHFNYSPLLGYSPMDQSLEPRRKRTAQRDRRQKRKRKEKGKGSKSEKGFSLSCCRKGQKVKRVEKRESKGKKKKGKMASKSRSRKSRSKSKKKRKSKKSKKRKRSKKSKSRKARGRKSRRRKSRSRRSRSKSRSKRVKSIGKEDVIRDNRAHLVRSQSLTGPSKDTSQSVQRDPTLQGSPLVTLDAPITPFSPMKKGAILKAAPPVLESNVSDSDKFHFPIPTSSISRRQGISKERRRTTFDCY